MDGISRKTLILKIIGIIMIIYAIITFISFYFLDNILMPPLDVSYPSVLLMIIVFFFTPVASLGFFIIGLKLIFYKEYLVEENSWKFWGK
jgi:hypothetical protein